jgi:hypothetical protein
MSCQLFQPALGLRPTIRLLPKRCSASDQFYFTRCALLETRLSWKDRQPAGLGATAVRADVVLVMAPPCSRGCQSRFTATGSSGHCTGVSGFLLVPHLLQRHSKDLTLLGIDRSRGRHGVLCTATLRFPGLGWPRRAPRGSAQTGDVVLWIEAGSTVVTPAGGSHYSPSIR